MQLNLQKIKNSLLLFLELQLLISIVILPILIAWGLPISLMSICGNLIFAQTLALFIGLSALLFTTNLIGIPNYWIAQGLEWVTACWYYILSYGNSSWLIGIPSWLFPISLLCAAGAYALYAHTKFDQKTKIKVLLSLVLLPLFLHTITFYKNCSAQLHHGSALFYLIKIQGTVYAFDYGALEARPSNGSWIEYTLLPTVIKTMGSTHIDTLILCKPNSRTPESIKQFMRLIPTQHLAYLQKRHHKLFAQLSSPQQALLAFTKKNHNPLILSHENYYH